MPTKVVVFSNMAISDIQAAFRPEKGLSVFEKTWSRNIFTALNLTVLTDYIIL